VKLAIAGGGTGGHVFPAVAVAREWLRRGPEREVLLVGTERGMEARLVAAAGLPFAAIPVAGLKGIGGLRFLRNLALLGPAMVESNSILERHRFAAAFGVGGYASGPFVLAAALAGVPTVIFEPNAAPGFTNRVLARMANRVATAYEATAARLGGRAVVTGIPVRAAFFEIAPRPHVPPFRLLITGGSQGSLVVNRAVIDSLDLLLPRKNQLFVVHQSGERDYNAVRVAYARRELNAEVVPFISNMAEEFARTDLIVCRAGAITAAEVAAAGRAAIFIPFGAATDSHQLRNAQALEAAGAARVIPEPQLSPQRLVQEISSLLDQPERMEEMERRARALARPRAVADIVNLIEEVARR
jgi:UDP-N-acetylglucosamine--N-acetylmuramyl-(pentapeptide) pyrophosphoryl-undecaprenol N-acetylglucosamine transferase